jgi:hypothetical protein
LNQWISVEKRQISGIRQVDTEMETERDNNFLGMLKWVIIEYDKIRILKIFEENKTIFVLINSNTQLEHTVDNMLGYYYDFDDTPKSLF